MDFDDFNFDKYSKKVVLMDENPEKARQIDTFHKPSTTESESARSVIEIEQEVETKYSHKTSEASEEKGKQKSKMRRPLHSLFDASSEASRDIRDEVEVDFHNQDK